MNKCVKKFDYYICYDKYFNYEIDMSWKMNNYDLNS